MNEQGRNAPLLQRLAHLASNHDIVQFGQGSSTQKPSSSRLMDDLRSEIFVFDLLVSQFRGETEDLLYSKFSDILSLTRDLQDADDASEWAKPREMLLESFYTSISRLKTRAPKLMHALRNALRGESELPRRMATEQKTSKSKKATKLDSDENRALTGVISIVNGVIRTLLSGKYDDLLREVFGGRKADAERVFDRIRTQLIRMAEEGRFQMNPTLQGDSMGALAHGVGAKSIISIPTGGLDFSEHQRNQIYQMYQLVGTLIHEGSHTLDGGDATMDYAYTSGWSAGWLPPAVALFDASSFEFVARAVIADELQRILEFPVTRTQEAREQLRVQNPALGAAMAMLDIRINRAWVRSMDLLGQLKHLQRAKGFTLPSNMQTQFEPLCLIADLLNAPVVVCLQGKEKMIVRKEDLQIFEKLVHSMRRAMSIIKSCVIKFDDTSSQPRFSEDGRTLFHPLTRYEKKNLDPLLQTPEMFQGKMDLTEMLDDLMISLVNALKSDIHDGQIFGYLQRLEWLDRGTVLQQMKATQDYMSERVNDLSDLTPRIPKALSLLNPTASSSALVPVNPSKMALAGGIGDNLSLQQILLPAYELLDLDYGVPLDRLRRRYIALARQYHPDKQTNANSGEDEDDKFSRMHEAYEFLVKYHENAHDPDVRELMLDLLRQSRVLRIDW